MAEYTETQRRILEVGKKEFLSKGFKDASLRGIVKEAGFTQGAFYGYYPDKAALFDALVDDAAGELLERFHAVQAQHDHLRASDLARQGQELSTQYLRQFVDYIYDHIDAFRLIVCCSEGTHYAHYVHDLIRMEAARTEQYCNELKKMGLMKEPISPELYHIITSAYFSGIFETVAHNMTREEALQHITKLSVFFSCGWRGLLNIE